MPSLPALVEVPLDDPAAQEALTAYAAELSEVFGVTFAPGRPSAAEVAEMARPDGVFVVARDPEDPAGRAVACGGVRRLDPDTVEVKRMWVAPSLRGTGAGGRLLTHLEGLAVELGCRRIVLDTNLRLASAVALYERRGYERVERYNDNPYAEAWFAKAVHAGPGPC